MLSGAHWWLLYNLLKNHGNFLWNKSIRIIFYLIKSILFVIIFSWAQSQLIFSRYGKGNDFVCGEIMVNQWMFLISKSKLHIFIL